MSTLNFTKMQAAGNDFVVIDNRYRELSTDQIIELAPAICDRRFGVGGDGIICLQPPGDPSRHYRMFYRNADGSDAGMCGNGARCLALLASKLGMGNELIFNVHQNTYRAAVKPRRKCVRLRFPMEVQPQKIAWDDEQQIYRVQAGTEHIVLVVSADEMQNEKQLRRRGEQLRYHPDFNPPGTNVNFIRGQSPEKIMIKTYERGVENLTLACGTGAVAGAIAWHYLQGLKSKNNNMTVQAEGGTLHVHFTYNDTAHCYADIDLSGEARFVFEGQYEL